MHLVESRSNVTTWAINCGALQSPGDKTPSGGANDFIVPRWESRANSIFMKAQSARPPEDEKPFRRIAQICFAAAGGRLLASQQAEEFFPLCAVDRSPKNAFALYSFPFPVTFLFGLFSSRLVSIYDFRLASIFRRVINR